MTSSAPPLPVPRPDSADRAGEACAVLLVDDHAVFSEALAGAITAQVGFGRVDVARDGDGAVRAALECPPDLAVIDLKLGGQDGLSVLARLVEVAPQARCVILTGHLQRDVAVRARALGAMGALPKGMGLGELLDALRRVLAGELVFWGVDDSEGVVLTAREAEVLQLIANGSDPRQVARTLGLSPHTVRDHVKGAREKLRVHSQVAAVVAAVAVGAIELPRR